MPYDITPEVAGDQPLVVEPVAADASPPQPPVFRSLVWRDGMVVGDDMVSVREPTAEEGLVDQVAQRMASLKELRDAIIFDAFVFDTHWMQCDPRSRADLSDTQLKILSGVPVFPTKWRDADNGYLPIPDVAVWANLMGALALHVERCWAAFWEIEDRIKASAAPQSEPLSSQLWPQTRIEMGDYQ